MEVARDDRSERRRWQRRWRERTPTNDEWESPAVGFQFNSKELGKFGELTGSHLPDRAAI